MKKDVPLGEIEALIKGGNPWVKFVPNQREISVRELTPEWTLKLAGRVGPPVFSAEALPTSFPGERSGSERGARAVADTQNRGRSSGPARGAWTHRGAPVQWLEWSSVAESD